MYDNCSTQLMLVLYRCTWTRCVILLTLLRGKQELNLAVVWPQSYIFQESNTQINNCGVWLGLRKPEIQNACALCSHVLPFISTRHVTSDPADRCNLANERIVLQKRPRGTSMLCSRENQHSLFLEDDASICTERIRPDRKSKTGTMERIQSFFKIKHPVQTEQIRLARATSRMRPGGNLGLTLH